MFESRFFSGSAADAEDKQEYDDTQRHPEQPCEDQSHYGLPFISGLWPAGRPWGHLTLYPASYGA